MVSFARCMAILVDCLQLPSESLICPCYRFRVIMSVICVICLKFIYYWLCLVIDVHVYSYQYTLAMLPLEYESSHEKTKNFGF